MKYFPLSIILRILVAFLLFWALDRHQYSYYTLLRWITCGVGLYCTYIAVETGKRLWAWIFGIAAIIFNPIFPIHLDRNVWAVIDIVLGILLLISIFFVREKKQPKPKQPKEHVSSVYKNKEVIGETKICPYCAEEIKVDAKKCKHCGEWLKKENRGHQFGGHNT